MVYISRYVLSKNAISLIHSKTGFTSKVNVYPGSLALNIPFKSLWITGCLPNDIQLVVGKIDDNTALAVFWTEYSQLDSLNNFAWNSVLSLTLAIKGSIFRLDENLNQQMVYVKWILIMFLLMFLTYVSISLSLLQKERKGESLKKTTLGFSLNF